jgi:CHASE2 domain-containing sensor protein
MACVGLALVTYGTSLFASLEGNTIDARFAIRGSIKPPGDLVIVGVDTPSFDAMPQYEWPYPRRLEGRLIDRIEAQHPKLIVFDVQFSERSSIGDETPFVTAISDTNGRIVFGTTETLRNGDSGFLGEKASALIKAGLKMRIGYSSLPVDSGGVIRRMIYRGPGGRPSLSVAAAELVGGRRLSRASHKHGTVYIDYYGRGGTFPEVPYATALTGKAAPGGIGRLPPNYFRGKIVVVGAVASSLQDIHPTSTDSQMSGPEVVANTIETALHGFPLTAAPGWIDVMLIVALGCVVPIVSLRLGPLRASALALALGGAFLIAAQLVFNSGTVMVVVYPMLALVLSTVATMALGLRVETRERQRLRGLFAANAPTIVDQILSGSGSGTLKATDIIDGYRMESAIGRGGMGVVYRATQLSLDRPVAIKLITPERAADPEFRERFKHESRLAATIEHVNVIPVYEAGEDNGVLYIAMRLVEGVDLAKVLARSGALEPRRAAAILTQLAAAIDAAHEPGLVHRDIKPANVMLTLDRPEHVYLTDFGIAKELGANTQATAAGQWVGTMDYLAPEQIRGERVDRAADIYAATGVLYHCLTGTVPFPRENEAAELWAHINSPPPVPTQLVPALPSAIDQVVARGMAKEPADRYETAADLARACSMALGLPVEDPGPAAPRSRAERQALAGKIAPTAIPG